MGLLPRVGKGYVTDAIAHRSRYTDESRGAVEAAAVVAVPQHVDIAARLDLEPLPHDFTPDQRLLTGGQELAHTLASLPAVQALVRLCYILNP